MVICWCKIWITVREDENPVEDIKPLVETIEDWKFETLGKFEENTASEIFFNPMEHRR